MAKRGGDGGGGVKKGPRGLRSRILSATDVGRRALGRGALSHLMALCMGLLFICLGREF